METASSSELPNDDAEEGQYTRVITDDAVNSTRQPQLSVLVAHFNEVSRWGLSAMLNSLPFVRSAPNCTIEEATSMLQVYSFDMLIADSMAQQALGHIVRSATERGVKCLALLRDTSRKSITHAAAFAVDGFILECTLNLRTLSDALLRMGRGEVPLPPEIAKEMLAALRSEDKAPVYAPFLLTPREHEVLQLLSAGLTNKQIARHLQISDHGAKRHVANVLAKMNCPNRTHAAAYALQHGLLGST